MILKETIRAVVKSQKQELSKIDFGVEREKLKTIETNIPFALIISGIRRCGKSTLLKQIMKKTKKFYYLNFEDPRLFGFEVNDFYKLDEVLNEEYGEADTYFFDEIQNIDKWEVFVRSMLEKKKHFVITGSNASLLSKELGTKLTGRHIRTELFPFSYNEFLKLCKKNPDIKSFEDYLNNGGFPEYLKIKKQEILQQLIRDITSRDIVVRHKLKNAKTINELATYLFTNVGKEFSYTKLKKTFNLGSTTSAINFVSYFEDSYVFFVIQKFDYSLKKMSVNPKKIYSIDNGLAKANSVAFSENKGRMLENAVFLNLRRKNQNIYYFVEKNECDFLVKEKEKISQAIQVCYELNESNKQREINGLLEAMNKFDLETGLILTYNQEDDIEIGKKKIKIVPVWKWFSKQE